MLNDNKQNRISIVYRSSSVTWVFICVVCMILENIFENHANEDIDYVTVTRQLHAFVLRAWVIVEGHKRGSRVNNWRLKVQKLRVKI